jgi:arabinofuranan 3-O-arabinosyltransferase
MSAELRDRLRTAISALVLFTLAFSIAPGRLLPDTKLDMPLNPGAFLARALHMWDPSAYFGQVQNMAYGYFFPMGPFFLLGHSLSIPPWVTQRLWIALILCTAFLGIVKLAQALGIGNGTSRILAGFAYALAPKAQGLIAVNSSEFLPAALLPWIMLPLVRSRGSPRRAAALSALAVVCAGGINATAEFAVLLVPLVYLLTREKGPRKRRLLAWWLPLTAAATFWWLAPTYLMGRYIFAFLPYTETASTTTSVTSVTNALRGTAQWVGFLPTGFSPWWPAGNALSTVPWLIVVTGLVVGLGLMGLRRVPERTFLVCTALLGVAIIVLGHPSLISAPFSGQLRDLLDGVLSPFRNIHKFDALIRLPVALGLAQLVSNRHVPTQVASARLAFARVSSAGFFSTRLNSAPRRWLPGLAVFLVAASVVPAYSPGLGSLSPPTTIPSSVRASADWLNRHDGLVLAVPSQNFGEFLWGKVMDDPLQPLLKGRWANQMVTPGGSAGLARLMDEIDERFGSGRGSVGLGQVLRRMGVRYVLVRNDVDRGVLDGAWPARVHEAIAQTPSLTRVAGFGRDVGADYDDAISSTDQPYQQIEIFEVAQSTPVAAVAGQEPLRVSGGPEALLTLADLGLLGDRPVLFNSDHPDIVTDTLRRREVGFSDVRATYTTLAKDAPFKGPAKVKDFLEPGWAAHESVSELSGIASVTTSSSGSDLTAAPSAGSSGRHPFAALDGDPDTQWFSSGWSGAVGQWLRVGLTRPVDPGRISVAFGVSPLLGPAVSEVSVETEAGSLVQKVRKTRDAQTLQVPPGPTTWLRVKVTRTTYKPRYALGTRAAISELTIPGVSPQRSIAVPGTARDLVFTGQSGYASPCMRGSEGWTCSPYLGIFGEEGRAFSRSYVSDGSAKQLRGLTVLTDPATLTRLTGSGTVQSSSTLVDHPAALPRSAFDDDPATAWVSGLSDKNPRLSVDLGSKRTFSRLDFEFPARRPTTRITVSGGGETRDTLIGQNGRALFEPLTTDRLTITFPHTTAVQVSEVRVRGVEGPALTSPFEPLTEECGTGPTFNGTIKTRVLGATVGDLLAGRPVRFEGCSDVRQASGRQSLTLDRHDPFLLFSVALQGSPAAAPATVVPAVISQWTAEARTVRVSAGPASSLVIVNENFNAGWTASLNGTGLHPVKIDGWKQAWEVPAGASGSVQLSYEPDGTYRLILALGLALVLMVAVCAAVPGRSADWPALRPARLKRTWLLAPVLGFWVGGPAGLLIVPGVSLLGRKIPDWVTVAVMGMSTGFLALGVRMESLGYDWLHRILTDLVPQVLGLVVLGLFISRGADLLVVEEPDPDVVGVQHGSTEERVEVPGPAQWIDPEAHLHSQSGRDQA